MTRLGHACRSVSNVSSVRHGYDTLNKVYVLPSPPPNQKLGEEAMYVCVCIYIYICLQMHIHEKKLLEHVELQYSNTKSDAFATLGRQLNKSWQAPQG